jgi:uridine kinase
MKLRTNNRILLIDDKYGNRVPFKAEKISKALLKAAQCVGGFQWDLVEGVNAAMFGGRTDEENAEFLAHMVVAALNAQPMHLTPNSPPTLEEIQRIVVETLRFWGLRNVADEYQYWCSARRWVRKGVLREDDFPRHPWPVDLVEETSEWNRKMGCDTIQGVNEAVKQGRFKELIDASIARYEGQLQAAAKGFLQRKGCRVFIVTGPSSCGKTTTTHKITSIARQEAGMDFAVFSADNYFYGVDLHPADMFGDRDYERARAYEIPMMQQHILQLLDGRPIEMPLYDMKTGKRRGTEKLQLQKDQVLVIDCLHGLFPYLTMGVPDELKFKVFLFNANRIAEGDGSSGRAISFTTVNMIRRMLRDWKHRSKDPRGTLEHWHYVRDGELSDMLPFLRTAHAYVNGGLAFDLPVLKHYIGQAFPSPETLDSNTPLDAYLRSIETHRMLSSTVSLGRSPEELIPPDCHIREFIGGLSLAIPHQG